MGILILRSSAKEYGGFLMNKQNKNQNKTQNTQGGNQNTNQNSEQNKNCR